MEKRGACFFCFVFFFACDRLILESTAPACACVLNLACATLCFYAAAGGILMNCGLRNGSRSHTEMTERRVDVKCGQFA